MQKLLKSAELWEEGGQFVEVVKRHGNIFGVSAHIDDLWANTSEIQIRTLGHVNHLNLS